MRAATCPTSVCDTSQSRAMSARCIWDGGWWLVTAVKSALRIICAKSSSRSASSVPSAAAPSPTAPARAASSSASACTCASPSSNSSGQRDAALLNSARTGDTRPPTRASRSNVAYRSTAHHAWLDVPTPLAEPSTGAIMRGTCANVNVSGKHWIAYLTAASCALAFDQGNSSKCVGKGSPVACLYADTMKRNASIDGTAGTSSASSARTTARQSRPW
mmetsp:Transcript_25004/g.87163  ORF Transcript_25004/g.87163 Transcript_25004/m.87163 type:complete len:218 (-) Transcript_25004:1515-2168(-)